MKTSGFAVGFVLAIVGSSGVAGRNFRFHNNCRFTVWAGALNNRGFELPANGGWQMDPRSTKDVGVADNWQGRFWGRTSCDGNGHCETGDCGNRIACAGAGGVPPVTLAEFTLQGSHGQDYYDVSLVDGYNLPMTIAPQGGQGSCRISDCRGDMIRNCPRDLLQKNAAGQTIACMSGCTKYQKDEYCCRNGHNTLATCPAPYYAPTFSATCPNAYSYAYDDKKGTFTCTGANYEITFC